MRMAARPNKIGHPVDVPVRGSVATAGAVVVEAGTVLPCTCSVEVVVGAAVVLVGAVVVAGIVVEPNTWRLVVVSGGADVVVTAGAVVVVTSVVVVTGGLVHVVTVQCADATPGSCETAAPAVANGTVTRPTAHDPTSTRLRRTARLRPTRCTLRLVMGFLPGSA
jgi:hypothetical protein